MKKDKFLEDFAYAIEGLFFKTKFINGIPVIIRKNPTQKDIDNYYNQAGKFNHSRKTRWKFSHAIR